MGIGTSLGAYFDDELHWAASPYMMAPAYTPDNNVKTPDEVDLDKQLDQNDPMGIEVKDTRMPFPNNRNPDSDFTSRFGNLPPSGIMNDMKPQDHVPQLKRKFSETGEEIPFDVADVTPLHPPGTFARNTQGGDIINGVAKELGIRPPKNMIPFPTPKKSSVDEQLPVVKAGWKDNQEDFNNLSDDLYIKRIDKSPGFFLSEEMQKQPWKKYSDRAKNLTKQTYDLYKAGDLDTVESVHGWEEKTLTRGYNNTDEGKRLKAEALSTWGSKTTMTKNALWEAYMKHFQDLTAADAESEQHTPEMREQLEGLSLFDRIGRPQMDFKKHWAAGKFK